jgi:hypothetical protein
VEREGERQVIHLMTGGTFVPPPEDVLQVRELDPETFRASEWQRIQDKIEATTHPLDLYLDGVERCFELGLREEGFGILDRILSMEGTETDQIPILFIPDADEATLHDWRVAAGREKPRLPSSEAPGDVGTAVVTARQGEGASIPGREQGGREPSPAAVPSGAPDAAADPAELVKAAQLVAEAQMLYQGAARKEGMEDDLRKARDKLDRALEIVEPQPQGDDTARRLRRQIAQLLSDVARASPF